MHENGEELLERLRTALALPLDRFLPGADSVLEWHAPLYGFQRDGVQLLITRDRLLLADDMGLGKTVQAIAAIRILMHQRKLDSALIVAPASLLDQWRAEFERWAPELLVLIVRGPNRAHLWRYPSHVKVVSYETLRTDSLGLPPPGHPLVEEWGAVILDEAQRVKNRITSTSSTAKRLLRQRSWALTGTPLENRIDELRSILEFVDHAADGNPRHFLSDSQMLTAHRELQLRRKKAEVLSQLPPKQSIQVMLELTPAQRTAYERAEREGLVRLQAMGAEVRVQHVLELITRLKQLCNFEPISGTSAKLDDVRDRIEELVEAGHRALVFSQYTGPDFGVGALAAALSEFEPLTYTGALSSAKKSEVVQQFRGEPRHRVLILSLKAGGVGLNLQEASYVFHFDRWWNPATERQAEDRTHRLGQRNPVTVFKYTCIGTIEERIEHLLKEKQSLFDEIVDDVSLDLDLTQRLTASELFGLVGLESPRPDLPAVRPVPQGIVAIASALLEERGWDIRAQATVGAWTKLEATRADELGAEQQLLVHHHEGPGPLTPSAVAAKLAERSADARRVFLVPNDLEDAVRELITSAGATLWRESELTASPELGMGRRSRDL